MARLMLDSTVLIDALRGRPAAQRLRTRRRTGVEPWACVISVEEIWRGLRPEEEPGARRLFNGLRIAPLGVAEGDAGRRLAPGVCEPRRDAASSGLPDCRRYARHRGDIGNRERRRLPDGAATHHAVAHRRVAFQLCHLEGGSNSNCKPLWTTPTNIQAPAFRRFTSCWRGW